MRGALSWPSTVNPIPGPAGLGGVEYEGCESECLLVPSPLGVAHQDLGMQHRPYVEGHRRLSGMPDNVPDGRIQTPRSEENTSESQSLIRTSNAVSFCKTKN